MPVEYWICEGIGIEEQELVPFLDPIKLAQYMQDEKDYEFEDELLDEDSDFRKMSPLEQIKELIDYCDEASSITEILAEANKKRVLVSANDNCGKYFLLYPPSYPWQNTGDFSGLEEVKEYICDFVLPFCRDDVKRQQIYDIIDEDIYEFGVG